MGFLSTQAIIPPGTILPYAGSSAPTGWLLCDGLAYSRTTYNALFAAIGTTYGVGDNSTTFNLPKTSGVFLRGAGSQVINGITYTSVAQGTSQGDQMQGHKHANDGVNYLFGTSGLGYQANNGPQAQQRQFQVGNPSDDGSNGTPRTGTETRPANIVVNYIIKI